MVVHVQSSDFKKLLELQQEQLEHVHSIRSLFEDGAVINNKHEKESLEIQRQQLDLQEELVEVSKISAEELKRIKSEDAETIANMAETVKTFDSLKDKFTNFGKGLSEKFGSLRATGTTALKAVNVGGVFDKKIASREFADQQKKLGSEKSYKELSQDFEERNKTAKQIKSNEAELQKFKKDTGLSDKDVAKTKEGQRLLEKRESLSESFKKTDLRAQIVTQREPAAEKVKKSPAGAVERPKESQRLSEKREAISDTITRPVVSAIPAPSPAATEKTNKEQNDEMNVSEEEMESARQQQAQTDLLTKIEKNTSAMGGDKMRAAAPSDSGAGAGGLLGALGAGFKVLGEGIKSIGAGAGAGIKALLIGIAQGVKALANPQVLLGLGAAVLAFMGIGKALEYAAPFMEAFAPVLIKVADVVQNVFVAAIEKIPEIIGAVGDVVMGVIGAISDAIIGTIDAITSSIERLAAVDGANLLAVGAGLLAVSGGMAAFAAANVVGGLGNLVGGLLSKVSGQKSPVDQIIALGENGPNIEKAGVGVEKLGTGLKMFSEIDPEKIKAIAALPTDKIVAMGAAMGQANFVSNQSAANDGARTAAVGSSGGGNTVVAPTTNNNTTQNQIVQLPVRNQEQTMNRYIKTRFA